MAGDVRDGMAFAQGMAELDQALVLHRFEQSTFQAFEFRANGKVVAVAALKNEDGVKSLSQSCRF